MTEPYLRLHDGFADTSPSLRPDVGRLQRMLRGHDPAIVPDGRFDRGTERAVRSLQTASGLTADGVVGPLTWHALLTSLGVRGDEAPGRYRQDHPELLADLEAACHDGAVIERIAAKSGLLPSVIVALASRESGFGRRLEPEGPGGTADFAPRPWRHPERGGDLPPDGLGFQRGLLRIDYDRHAFARNGAWRSAESNLRFGADSITAALATLRRETALAPRARLRAALAAWNVGLGSVMRALRQGLDIDFYTSGRDYARDVLDRAAFFQAHGFD